MKELKNLVPDIYKELEKISEGKSINLTEKDIDNTLAKIKESMMAWATPSERDNNFTLRMSNIGRPARQLWYQKRDELVKSSIDGPTQIKFLYGHILEEIVLMLVRMAGHKVTDEQKEVKVKGVVGHIDCKINNEIVDIKTASGFAFKKFIQGRLAEDDPFGYLGQLAGYEKSEGTNNGGFLVINKESGELCLHQPEDLDKPNITNKIDNLISCLDIDDKPERCYDPVPEGKKGNYKLHKSCFWCNYKFDCFKDVNNGQGLRGFKYANSTVYLTHVEVEPQVEEIL
tara:strand:+ start:1825 stop:2682 length:858 start_codon:yes stop_codon:yes gene_type:complete